MLQCIYRSTRSLAFELHNEDIYFASQEFDVYLNHSLLLNKVKTNVFSLFDLIPNTEYEIAVGKERLRVKTEPEHVRWNVRDLGIFGDGVTPWTSQLQSLINSIPPHSTLFFPKGVYLTGPLFLKSHLTLELHRDATLKAITKRDDYPILPAQQIQEDGTIQEISSWEGESQPTFASLITAIQQEHIHIIGQGCLDGSGKEGDWWQYPKEAIKGAYRPKTVFPSFCNHFSLHGIQVMNSPSWTIHPYFSKHVNVIDVTITNPKDSPNTDGCNPESSEFVKIIGVDFSVGDDCIAIKSGKYQMGMKYRTPSKQIEIRNCRMQFGHGAIVLGSEMSGGIQDLFVRNCLFVHTDRGLRVKTRRGRGNSAVIDGILFEQIKMDHVLTPLVINMFYNCDPLDGKTEYVYSKECLPVDERTPYLGDFTFRNILCDNVHVAAGFFYGLPEQPIASITLEDITFKYASDPQEGVPAMMSFLEPMKGTGLHFYHVNHVSINKVKCLPPIGETIQSFASLIEVFPKD